MVADIKHKLLFPLLLFILLVSAMHVHANDKQVHQAEDLRNEDGDVCLAPPETIAEDDCTIKHAKVGRTDPRDVVKLTVFEDWTNGTMELKGETLNVARGCITWPLPLGRQTKFSVLPALFPKRKIDKVLSVLRRHKTFDDDTDSVDRMPTHEIFVHEGPLHLYVIQ